MIDKILKLTIPVLLFFFPIIAVLSLSLLIDEQLTNNDLTSFQILDMIRKTPMTLEFYIFIAILLGLFLGWYSYLYIKLQNEFESGPENIDQHNLDPSERDVYRRFRERAFTLRTGASVTLICIFFLLLSGIYFIFFILIPLNVFDRLQLKESVLQATIVERFRDKFRSMEDGRYWFTANGIQHGEKKTVSLLVFGGDDGCEMGRPNSIGVNFVQTDFGYIAYDNGDVFLTKDGGQNWVKVHLNLKPDDYIIKAAVDDERKALLVSSYGSVFLIFDAQIVNEQIKPVDTLEYDTTSPDMGEKAAHLCLNKDGNGLILGDNGSIFITSNGGKDWMLSDSLTKLPNSNQRLGLAISSFTRNGLGLLEFHPRDDSGNVIHNSLDTIFVTDNFAKSWEPANFPKISSVFNGDILNYVRLHENGLGLVLTDSNNVFITDDAGKNWKMSFNMDQINNLDSFMIDPYLDSIVFADLNENGVGLIFTRKGQSFYKENREAEWINRENINHFQNPSEFTSFYDYIFRDDLLFGLAINIGGSIFLTTNGGNSWNSVDSLSRFPYKDSFSTTSITLSNNNKQSLIIRSPSEIFITDDFTTNWDLTEWDVEPSEVTYLIGVTPDDGVNNALTLAVDNEGNAYFLKKSVEIAGWENKSALNFTKELSKFPHIKRSKFFQEVEALVAENNIEDNGNNNQQAHSVNTNQGLLGILSNELLISRTITMIFLFFLVHLLVRLYQYSIRLAAFWDARSDAILMRNKFVQKKTETFDELILALTPEAYDFKPLPKSTLNLSSSTKTST